ncbi:3-ketodihydrosphingosine reductase-like [Tropilaelaps mercedesae]|uniref:3-ketodihydrosphingosine reductase-like n=1 Tax=Tropilaelaps mercedesae TaxID=418985 RepID=A0A1V9XBL0_9ACAR|nr:3-ketodihydrosphingosine reductase-like [Tropilaelaps mercedesae]
MILVFIASLLGGLLLSALLMHKKNNRVLKDKHLIISGGSSGIGLELVRLAFNEGAKVTLVARNETTLQKVTNALSDDEHRIGYVAIDLSSNLIGIQEALAPAFASRGNVDVLINCAGSSVARYIEDTTEEMYRQMMACNLYSAVNLTKACLTSLEKRCGEQGYASVVFLSSIAGLMGIYGYTAYSASKFALIGFAQALLAEKQHLGLHVMVAFPPDTETPGFTQENIGKPPETIAISQLGGLQKPGVVAKAILDDICQGRVMSSIGLDGQLVCTAASGLWPVSSALKLISETALIAPGRLLGAYLHWAFARCANVEREKRATAEGAHITLSS